MSMTFKGMLKILINEYRKQHEEKMFSIVQELIKTQRELKEVKEKLQKFQLNETTPLSNTRHTPTPTTISLFVQYNGFFNQLCELSQSITIDELLIKLRQLTGIPSELPIHVRVLSEDGLTTEFFLDRESNRTLASYNNRLKARMILSIDDIDEEDHHHDPEEKHLQQDKNTTTNENLYSFDESDV